MNEQKTLDYARIAQAIGYIRENFKRQPGLDEIAGEVATRYAIPGLRDASLPRTCPWSLFQITSRTSAACLKE